MFGREILNPEGVKLARNIFNNFRTHPNYISYDFDFYEELGCAVINITKNGNLVNMYRFYPRPISADIGSIAIYGIALKSHYDTINSTKNIFGFRVSDIEIVSENTTSPFVDIMLK